MRVFLDTNVLASAVTTRGLCAELFELVLETHDLLSCDEVLKELSRILPSKLGLSNNVTQDFITLIRTHSLLVSAELPYPSLPDPDDEPIVAAAIAGDAEVFVTGDKALLELRKVVNLPIVSPREFWEMSAGRG